MKMQHVKRAHVLWLGSLLLLTVAAPGRAQGPKITSPKEQFGHEIGADYVLPNYTQLTEYWKKLDRESDRMTLQSIGKTAEGRDQWMAVITSPENMKRLDRYKEIARRLQRAEGLTDEQARSLAAEGRAVVWIDGGLHGTEVLGAQQLMELVYQMVSRNDPETQRILRDVILLAVHANPDGMELVSNWYMREKDPQKRSTQGLPRLYQKYIGHDNNRDFYLSSQPETTNMNRVMYLEWYPQVMYNHHQTGPAGTVLFAPPFRDPFNYNLDPLIPLGIDMVGAAIHGRFAAEGKPGATMRRGASYSTWFNGGLRTTAYFHNIIGILTETIGNPTPMRIPFLPQRQLASGDLPYPIAPQEWHFRQSVEYSISANRAILDLASRNRETLLFNIYRMGRNSIERGSHDSWTITPKRIDAVQEAIAKDAPRAEAGGRSERSAQPAAPGAGAAGPGGRTPGVDPKYFELLHDPRLRDARGYVIPSDQADFPTAVKFVNALLKTGVSVERARASFEAAGQKFPAGSYVVKTAQAYRPHILDMFEPQDHPNDFQYPGGPPIPPYDNAGYTLAMQMGVRFERVLDAIDGPFERVSGLQRPAAGQVPPPSTAGYLLSHSPNDAFVAVNRLLKAGEEVYWLQRATAVGGSEEAGALFVAAKPSTLPLLQKCATDLGVSFHAASSRPDGPALRVRPVRIALVDRYGGSMPSGWIRWLFEQFEFPFDVVYPQALDAGKLRERFDVIVLPSGAVPGGELRGSRGTPQAARAATGAEPAPQPADFFEFQARPPENLPEEFKGWTGSITAEKTIPQLRAFVEQGGTLIAIGSSVRIAQPLGLPLGDALVERTAEGERPLSREKFYVPGSLLRVAVDGTHPLAHGLASSVDVMFDSSPVFEMLPDAPGKGVRAVSWFDSAQPLRSGWAWGQHYLKGGVAVAEAPLGAGSVFLFGPEITVRGQSHGAFKFLFNAIYYGPAKTGAAAAPSL
jgi:hypothetical protein